MLLALIGVTSAWAVNYGIKIGGVQLTSDNYTNITVAGGFSAVKSGAVTFNPTTKTLTLSNAVIEAEGNNVVAIDVTTSGSGYKLQLASGTTNSVSSSAGNALRLYDTDFTIEGTGTVTFTSPNKNGIYLYESDAALTIRNCTVTVTGGNSGITGSSSALGSLTIDGATVRATGTARGSIWCFHTLTLSGGVEIFYPEGAVWNTTYNCVCMPSDVRTPIMTEVVIRVPPVPEPLTVTNEMVLNTSRYDVDGSGDLTLSDLTLLANALVGKVNYPLTDLSLSKPQTSVLVNGTTRLVATVAPQTADYNALGWTTSNQGVATVALDGTVTGVSAGSCFVTAFTLDGSGLRDSCLVTVIDPSTLLNPSDYVDLGLPSGTLWATCNVGADHPYEYGDYFSWGETIGYNGGKTTFNWETYQYCKGTKNTLTKYCSNSAYGNNGFTDTLTELEPEDDAACMYWDSNWRTPSKEQFDELNNSNYTTVAFSTLYGVKGLLITSKTNSKSIFLPAAGSYDETRHTVDGPANYWSRSLRVGQYPYEAWRFYFYDNSHPINTMVTDRTLALPIRPVRNQ